jgi:hypothetical protein
MSKRQELASFEKFASKKAKRGCPTGKRRFSDHKQAINALHSSKRIGQMEVDLHGHSTRNEKRTYLCGLCGGGFHLTSQNLREMAA